MKPEWCPQWATDEATRVYHSLENSHVFNEIAITRALLDAHQRGRREGMEEAAKVADSYANDAGDKAARGYFTETERASRSMGRSIATAIRAKMEEQP